MAQARFSYAAVASNEKIYVAGGKSNADSTLSSVECYDISEDTWTTLSNMNHPRENFALAAIDGDLYAIGYDKTIEQYDSDEDTWTEVRA